LDASRCARTRSRFAPLDAAGGGISAPGAPRSGAVWSWTSRCARTRSRFAPLGAAGGVTSAPGAPRSGAVWSWTSRCARTRSRLAPLGAAGGVTTTPPPALRARRRVVLDVALRADSLSLRSARCRRGRHNHTAPGATRSATCGLGRRAARGLALASLRSAPPPFSLFMCKTCSRSCCRASLDPRELRREGAARRDAARRDAARRDAASPVWTTFLP